MKRVFSILSGFLNSEHSLFENWHLAAGHSLHVQELIEGGVVGGLGRFTVRDPASVTRGEYSSKVLSERGCLKVEGN